MAYNRKNVKNAKIKKAKIFLMLLFIFIFAFGCIGQNKEQNNITEQKNNSNIPITQQQTEQYSLSIIYYNQEIREDQENNITVQVYSSKPTTVSLLLVYGKKSVPYPSALNDYEFQTSIQQINAPGLITIPVKPSEPGTYYLRAYAFINGKPYWSNEISFDVKERKEEKKADNEFIITEQLQQRNELRVRMNQTVSIKIISKVNYDIEVSYEKGSFTLPARGDITITIQGLKTSLITLKRDNKKIGEIVVIPS
jgi:hypothetical protein